MKQNLRESVSALVRQVPEGRVTTYGAVARAMGSPGLARAVGNALCRNGDSRVPCWRVVNAQGRLAPHYGVGGPDIQRLLLEAEGVEVTDGRVDLDKYGYFFPTDKT